MNIRPARQEDALAIATIHVETWRAAYRGIVPDEYLRSLSIEQRHGFWQRNLADAVERVWIAEEAGAVVGWLSADGSRDADASPYTGEIWAVYVDAAHWGKGAGRALCAVAEQSLREQGCTETTLWVLRENERAIRFYRSIGYADDDSPERSTERSGKVLSEVRMRKRLA